MKVAFLLIVVVLVTAASAARRKKKNGEECVCREYSLPEDFLLGAATASYQIEGAWDEDGKGESIWDHLTHGGTNATVDNSTGDIAADSYHHYKEDVQILKDMNMNTYRFSISWPRILPKGTLDEINEAGIQYYKNLIDELLKNNIKPMVTMYHWDLPYALQTLGGWANPQTAYYFRDYADLLFKELGEKVEWWITFNEPQVFCFAGYGSEEVHHAPDVDKPGVGEYLCGHTLLVGHALTYELYNEKYRDTQKGQVGITLNSLWDVPKTTSKEDKDAAERSRQFWLGWFANPIFSSEGDYPEVMKARVGENSEKENLRRSRLPEFTEEEIKLLNGSSDFFGLNHYTTRYVEDGEGETFLTLLDTGITTSQDEEWETSGSDWLKVVPWGFRENLKWIKKAYNSPKIIVTENGVSDNDGTLKDDRRVNYFRTYLREMVKAMEDDKVNVLGYTAWSLLDNFEWTSGYTERFGLYHVDFEDGNRKRTPKKSAKFFEELGKTHIIPRKLKS